MNSFYNDGLTTQFKVNIPGLQNIVFKSCEGINSEVEVISLQEGGSINAPQTVRGAQMVHQITFSHGTGATGANIAKRNLLSWYLDVCDSNKQLEKKTINITIQDSEGNTLSEWKALNAWPCRWIGPMLSAHQNLVAVERVGFAHEGLVAER